MIVFRLTPLVILAVCAWLIFRCVTPAFFGPREPRCGKCRYPLAGLTTGMCPECGGRFEDVGVEARFQPRRGVGVLPLALVSWGVLAGIATLVAFVVAALYSISVSNYQSGKPNTDRYELVEVWTNDGLSPERPFMLMALVTGPSGRAILELDLRTRECVMLDPAGKAVYSGLFQGVADVESVFSMAGARVADELVWGDAKGVDAYIRQKIAHPQNGAMFHNGFSLMSSEPSNSPAQPKYTMVEYAWIDPLDVPVFGLVVALLGTVLIVWRRRTMLRRARAEVLGGRWIGVSSAKGAG